MWPVEWGKEMHFFSDLALKLGPNETYESFWPQDYISGNDRSAPLLDATPAYLQNPRAPMRIRAMVPQARIVVLVRVRSPGTSCQSLCAAALAFHLRSICAAALPSLQLPTLPFDSATRNARALQLLTVAREGVWYMFLALTHTHVGQRPL